MIPYFSDVIFNTRRLALKEATTLQDTTTLTQRKSSEYSLPSEISSLLILVCFLLSRKGYFEKKTIGTTGSSNGHNNNIFHKNNDLYLGKS